MTTPKGKNNSVISGIGAGNAMIASTNNNTAGESVFIGASAGTNTTGESNTFVGWGSGPVNTTGIYNTFIGRSAGNAYVNGTYSTIIGALSGLNTTGSNNTFIGFGVGYNITSGSSNVCLGTSAGPLTGNGAINHQLFIDNMASNNPLIWGDFWNDQLKFNGKVGIGGNSTTGYGIFPTTAGTADVSNYKLFVEGGILSEEVRVALNTTWADYVFAPSYQLKTIDEVASFIKENGHLPNVPSAKQVEAEGINVAEMATIQMEKIEELTLYIIELKKEIDALKAKK